MFVKDLNTGAVALISTALNASVALSYDGTRVTYGSISGDAAGGFVTQILPPTLHVNPINGNNYVNATNPGITTISGTSDAIGELVLLTVPGALIQPTAIVQANGTWSTSVVTVGHSDGGFQLAMRPSPTTSSWPRTRIFPFTIDCTPPTDVAITLGRRRQHHQCDRAPACDGCRHRPDLESDRPGHGLRFDDDQHRRRTNHDVRIAVGSGTGRQRLHTVSGTLPAFRTARIPSRSPPRIQPAT